MTDPSLIPAEISLADGRRVPVPSTWKGFRHIHSPFGTLIVPSDTKQSWQIDERPFRSLLISDDGRVLSSGFPKFGNFKERGFEDHHEDLKQALKHSRPVLLTDKLDGSLIIRAVFGGKVRWRTRGSWALGPFKAPVMALASAYPALSDPGFMSDQSLLFEFCSSDPQLRVVLAHERDSLTLIGAVSHHSLKLASYEDLGQAAEQIGCSLVQVVALDGSLNEWRKQVSAWTAREGVVIRLENGGMLKLKSVSYLNLHRLKTSFSMRAAKRLILAEGLRSKERFTRYLTDQGADWETVKSLEPLIDATSAAHAQAQTRFPQLSDQVDLLCIQNPGRRDRQRDAVNQLADEAERQAALLLLDGRELEAERTLERLLVERALTPFDDDLAENLDEG